jgi:hypothetical protein
MERERDRDLATPEIYERLRGKGYPWKRVKDRYKNGQPKVSPDSFQYALRYTLDGGRWFPTFKTVEDLTVALGRVQVQIHAAKHGIELLNQTAPKQRAKAETTRNTELGAHTETRCGTSSRSMAVQQCHDHQQPPQRRIRLGSTRPARNRSQTPGTSHCWVGDFVLLCCRCATGRCLHAPLTGLPALSRCPVGRCRHAADHARAQAKTHLRQDVHSRCTIICDWGDSAQMRARGVYDRTGKTTKSPPRV